MYQIGILTHYKKPGGIVDKKMIKFIRPVPTKEETISIGRALKNHVAPEDVLVAYDTESGFVVYIHDQKGGKHDHVPEKAPDPEAVGDGRSVADALS